jgi:hypoxanthine phosphoribosyltransferase
MINQKQLELSDKDVARYIHKIIRQMAQEHWRPDYIVGVTRGGLVPATMLSHYLDIPLHTLNVSLRDSTLGPESNLWMAEDAFGYVNKEERTDENVLFDVNKRKNILLVDDINDTGATLNWIIQDWQSGCLPNSEAWEKVWGYNVKFASLVDNGASGFDFINYSGLTINKLEDPCWVVFPWENWWEK